MLLLLFLMQLVQNHTAPPCNWRRPTVDFALLLALLWELSGMARNPTVRLFLLLCEACVLLL
jgi:hypothetical protein